MLIGQNVNAIRKHLPLLIHPKNYQIGYKRSYMRRDGTFVSEHWVRSRRGTGNNNESTRGAIALIILIIFFLAQCSK